MSERGTFNAQQRSMLLAPIQPHRVQDLDGISHLAAWDVVAHLNRVFGFEGWDKEIVTIQPVYEHIGQREIGHRRDCNRGSGCGCRNVKTVPACSVGYRCTMRLTVRDGDGNVVRVIEDVAMGTATNQRDMGDAHDLALKSAVSYALKRCAKDLGDQFGLSLYNKGQQTACVQRVFPYEEWTEESTHHVEVDVQADGIAEGDDGFGDKRGDRTEPAAEPVEQPAAEQPAEQPAAPVREPTPARPKAEKPEPTPPPAKPTVVEVDEETVKGWLDTIAGAGSVEDVKTLWKQEIQTRGALDFLVHDAEGQPTTLREVMVARVNEIEAA